MGVCEHTDNPHQHRYCGAVTPEDTRLADDGCLLSVVIPTLVRPTLVDTVAAFRDQIDQDWPGGRGAPEILVVVNPLGGFSDTQHDTLRACQRLGARIEHHPRVMHSAEESALAAANRADSTFIWLFGDDDRPLPGSLRNVSTVLRQDSPDAVLLNVELGVERFSLSRYYRLAAPPEQASTGLTVWKHLGFLSATTTISAWVLRRDLIDLATFERYHDISPIYSHSFYLFSVLHDRQVICTDDVCLIKQEEEIAEVQERFDALALGEGRHPLFSWTAGVMDLARAASLDTGIPVDELLASHELEVIRDSRVRGENGRPAVLHSTTRQIITRYFEQLMNDDGELALRFLRRLQDQSGIAEVVQAARAVDRTPSVERGVPIVDLGS